MSADVDLRTQLNGIKDQGRRGTCVACAATVAHEMIRGEGVELSIEFLHWAAKQCDGLPSNTEGTTLTAAKEALRREGQPPEAAWPYDDGRDQWGSEYRPPADATAAAKLRILTSGDEIAPDVSALRGALDDGHPVVLGLRIHTTWHVVGPDGRIAAPQPGARDLGGHAVVVVGYDNDDFIVQNSWGIDWGDGGFGYLGSGYVDAFGLAAWALSL